MKRLLGLPVLAAAVALHLGAAQAATFSYHGSLQDAGKPADGPFDLELTLYTSASGGRVIGGPLQLYQVPVHGGSFSTQADFGPLSDIAGTAWLGVRVRAAGNGDFAALAARAPVSADATASVCPGAWTTAGNAGTLPGTGLGQNYLGTADNQPLVIAVNGAQAGRIAPTADASYADATTIILGAAGNSVGTFGGATVGGGGTGAVSTCGPGLNQPCYNSATGHFATVGGGIGTSASADGATVSGGSRNSASSYSTTVSGGFENSASAQGAAVSGGFHNTASGEVSFVGSGTGNSATGFGSVVGGGGNYVFVCGPTADQLCSNTASGLDSTVAGGMYNRSLNDEATVGGGANNTASGFVSTVAGGELNTASGNWATIGGGLGNTASAEGAAVGGGGSTYDNDCGPAGNQACTNAAAGIYSTVAGGKGNNASVDFASVGGGQGNTASGKYSTVTGGSSNTASGTFASTGSGARNAAGGDWSYAAGYQATVRDAAHAGSGAGCGSSNTCGDFLSFVWSDGNNGVPFTTTGPLQFLIHAIGGVGINTAPPNNFIELTIAASPNGADVASAFLRQSSIAAGIILSSASASSTVNNDATFTVSRYNGSNAGLDLSIGPTGDFQIFSSTAIKPTGTTWSNPSDARLKRDVEPLVNTLDRVLRLRGVTFEYSNPDSYLHPAGRHTGFIAQEVQQVFPDWIGSTPDGYLTVGPNGFEALTVEALRDLRAEKDAEIATLQERLDAAAGRNTAMLARLDDLSERLRRLEADRER